MVFGPFMVLLWDLQPLWKKKTFSSETGGNLTRSESRFNLRYELKKVVEIANGVVSFQFSNMERKVTEFSQLMDSGLFLALICKAETPYV